MASTRYHPFWSPACKFNRYFRLGRTFFAPGVFLFGIHSNQVLSNVQKLTYLRAQLQGEAARVISGFPLTSGNYMPSVDLLCSQFAKPHKLVNAHMQALINLPNPSNTLTSLQQFYDSVESHTRSFTTLGKNRDSYGDMLVPITLGKLPTEIKRNLARERSSEEWTLSLHYL